MSRFQRKEPGTFVPWSLLGRTRSPRSRRQRDGARGAIRSARQTDLIVQAMEEREAHRAPAGWSGAGHGVDERGLTVADRKAWRAFLAGFAVAIALMASQAGALGLQEPLSDLNGNAIGTVQDGVSNAILGCVVGGFPAGVVWTRPSPTPGGTVPVPLPPGLTVAQLPLTLTAACYSVQGWGASTTATLGVTVAP
jgi:hypothetical protein